MDIQKEKLIAEIENFKTEILKIQVVKVWAESHSNSDPFKHVILEKEDCKVWWMEAQAHQLWETWLAAKAQAVPEGFVLVKMDDLELLRDSALEIKYASLNNDSDRIFSDIEDIQLSVERLIEAQEQNQ